MLAFALATLVFGSEQIGANVSPKFMNGVHFACEASFDVAVEDSAYYGGQPVVVSGSYSFYYWPDQSRLFVAMKLGVMLSSGEWRAPSNAYVFNGYRTNLSEQQAQSDAENPGFRLFVYDPAGAETVNAMGRLASEGLLDVAYTFEGGSMPMTFQVAYGNKHTSTWAECVDALITRDD